MINSNPDKTNTGDSLSQYIWSFFWEKTHEKLEEVTRLRSDPKWTPLQIFDFDDTIYSRKQTLKVIGLQNNRWEYWNKWILAKYSWKLEEEWSRTFWGNHTQYRDKISLDIGHTDFQKHASILWEESLRAFITNVLAWVGSLSTEQVGSAYLAYWREFYSEKRESEQKIWLVSNLDDLKNHVAESVCYVLTATTAPELTRVKLKLTGIDTWRHKIVPDWKTKILSLIEIVLELWYIPEEIIVYEDRPEHFLRCWPELSGLLWTKIIVKKVEIGEDNNLQVLEEKVYEEGA